MAITIKDIPILQSSNVRMKDIDSVLDKINKIVSKKKESLQVITDYDMTLTKQHVNGEKTPSSFGLLSLCDKLPEGFMKKDEELKAKYYPIEVDLKMTPEEKSPYMVEWYRICEDLWTGVRLEREDLRSLVASKKPALRDGTVELCKLLEENEIPTLVLSAGLGNVIAEVLKYHGIVENDYFRIISNFLRFNKEGVVEGFGCQENGLFIHPFNKNGFGCTSYFKEVGGKRRNVILMGDSLGDASMDQGVPDIETVLKIGFVYAPPNQIEETLLKFVDNFDIVLIDDQTMNVTRAIIDLVIKS